MKNKVCIVTGSNTGIGKETARGLAQLGAKVILACRDVQKAEAARTEIAATTGRGDLEVMPLDLGSKASIRAFAKKFQDTHDRLDVLVNNAGVWHTDGKTTADGLEAIFGVNHVGTFLLTQELLPLLKKSAPSRIVVVSSKLYRSGKLDFDDLQRERRKFKSGPAYNDSKLANILFTRALARRLEGTGVTVNALHPGVVATELIRDLPWIVQKIAHLFFLSPEKGAACSVHVASAPELAGVTGQYFEKSRIAALTPAAQDEATEDRLWKVTEALAA
jgi:NAD(P)-dependent dehydrogenase (short-subunit alcohol dehydrogenase family)